MKIRYEVNDLVVEEISARKFRVTYGGAELCSCTTYQAALEAVIKFLQEDLVAVKVKLEHTRDVCKQFNHAFNDLQSIARGFE